jgi:hypothetical protein
MVTTKTTGFYSYRTLDSDSQEYLSEWMFENRVPNALPIESLHCTVIDATNHFFGYSLDLSPIRVDPTQFRVRVMHTALVVSFRSTALQMQYDAAISRGATPTYPTFRPHVSVSYRLPISFSLWDLKPPTQPIYLEAEKSCSKGTRFWNPQSSAMVA